MQRSDKAGVINRDSYLEQIRHAETTLNQFTPDEISEEEKYRIHNDIDQFRSLIFTSTDKADLNARLEKINQTIEKVRKNDSDGNMDIRNLRLQARLTEMNAIAHELCDQQHKLAPPLTKHDKLNVSPSKKKHSFFSRSESMPEHDPTANPIVDHETRDSSQLLGK